MSILGCGSSGGVPRIGGDWGACDPNEPKNRRRRCSLLLERGDGDRFTRILVDSSPDLYAQMFGRNIQWLDAVLYTHHHADQTHGINDLRAFFLNRLKSIPVYMDDVCAGIMRARFDYCFEQLSDYPKFLDLHRLEAGRKVRLEGEGGDISALPFLLHHGAVDALGFRFGPIAYSPDVADIPEASFEALSDLECWIVDALRYQPHPTHAHLEKTLGWIDRVKPKRAILTNLHIDMDYWTLKKELPRYVEPAFDDMELVFAS